MEFIFHVPYLIATTNMNLNVYVFHTTEAHTMAFCSNIKLECWNLILNLMDNMSRIAVSKAIEGVSLITSIHGEPIMILLAPL